MEDKRQPFMLFPNIQSRIWAGILSFTGIMIVIFWIAINEPARMQEFTDRSEGRSIENGATLFESNCSSCHGTRGYGTSGVAPALNNPQLFGYDFFAEIDGEIATLQDEITEAGEEAETPILDLRLEHAEAQRDRLYAQLRYDYTSVVEDLEAQLAEVNAEIQEAGYDEPERLRIDAENLNAQIDELETELETADEERAAEIETELEPLQHLTGLNNQRNLLVGRIQDLQPLVDAQNTVDEAYAEMIAQLETMIEAEGENADLRSQVDQLEQTISIQSDERDTVFDELAAGGTIVPFDPGRPERLDELKWSGGLHDLVFTTVVGGRPTSSSYWPNPMAAWSQAAGGPLRDDQIDNVTNYILNWDREFEIEDIRNIRQFAIVPSAGGGDDLATAGNTDVDPAFLEVVGNDVNEIVATIAELEGDPQVGQQLFNSTNYGCGGCHMVGGAGVGPDPTGLAIRAQGHADENPDLETAQHYIVQSIVMPNAFVVENYQPNLMPPDFGQRLNYVNMADLVAYLMSFDSE
jgi:mono/diheme cytochrome c family protein